MPHDEKVPAVVSHRAERTGLSGVYVDVPDSELWKIRVAMRMNPMLYTLEEVEDVERCCTNHEEKQERERS